MKKILVTGGSGFIGKKLVEELLARGDRITVLSRNAEAARRAVPSAVRVAAWDPAKEGPWFDELDGVDAVFHLAGEPVGQRWTAEVKRRLVESRVVSTSLVVEAIARAKHKPSVLVSASGIGFYGPRPSDERVDEDTGRGRDFLADLAAKWEAAARAAAPHGVRAVQVRIGVVFGEEGGPLSMMVLPFRLLMGGPIGDGKQVVSWVHRDDAVGILLLALDDARVSGPINAVSPYPATSQELAHAIGKVMRRPAWLRAPASLVRVRLGEGADLVLTGQRVYPKRASELGYEFRQPRLVPALESILGGR